MHRFSIILVFGLGGSESEWRYDQGRISTLNILENYASDINFFQQSLEAIRSFIKNCYNNNIITTPPSITNISDGFLEEIKDENGGIRWEFKIGDLEVELIFNKEEETYIWNRTAFNLTWSDFLLFFNRLESFFKEFMDKR